MEVLVALGIAAVGYQLSKEPRVPRRARRAGAVLGRTDEYDRRTGPSATAAAVAANLAADEAAKRARWQDALHPRATGVIDPATAWDASLPYFRSAKSQNTNTKVKQTRMELFTGALDAATSATGTYRRKTEVAPMFKPGDAAAQRGPVTFSGSHGQPALDLDAARRRTWVSGLQNNVLPAPQVRVGPGLGLGPDRAVGGDGFHPMLRILPTNVGEYKKNNLPGRVNHGAAPVARRAADLGENAALGRPGKLEWDQERRPMEPTRAAGITAHERRPEQTRAAAVAAQAKKPLAGMYTGGAAGGAVGGPAGYVVPNATRDRIDATPGLPRLNVTVAEVPRTGGHVVFAPDMARFDAQNRETQDLGRLGVVCGAAAGGGFAPPAATGMDLPVTAREATHVAGTDRGFLGGQTSVRTRPFDAPAATLRDLAVRDVPLANPVAVGVRAPRADLAPAAPGGLDRNAKRAAYALADRTTGPGRVNVVADDAVGAVRVRSDACAATAAPLPTVPVPKAAPGVGEITSNYNKLPSNNPRVKDLDIARCAVGDNDLALRIN